MLNVRNYCAKEKVKIILHFKLKIILLIHFLNAIIIECMKSYNKDIMVYICVYIYIYKGTECWIKKSATKSYFFSYERIFGKFNYYGYYNIIHE